MKQPKLVSATQAELDELLALAKAASFPQDKYRLLEGVLGTFVYVMQVLQNTKSSLRRFRRMLFGPHTENKRNVLKENTGNDAGNDNQADAAPGDQGVVPAQDRPSELEGKRPGHGRNGVQAYGGATVVPVEHPSLKSGDQCPECPTGKVYAHEPREFVQVVGQPPLAATIYQIERLRCRLCDAIFSAPMPEEVGPQKYDESAASMIAMLRYGSGMPFFRLEGLQASLRVPLPDATQWDIVGKAVKGPRSVYEELIRQAAQAEVLHNDDTPARILALMAERTKAEARGEEPEAKAINTSGIVALLQERKVVLFFTGHRHAGQNLAEVLAHRASELEVPIQMCDGLSSNITKQFKTILCNCLLHGRRKFVEVVDNFPEPCRHVIEVLAKVYKHDARCRDQKMSPEQRLVYHQANSGSLMRALETWMKEQLEQRQVEPNSGLGGAMNYMIKHWQELTLFLRQAGAPLDNNICERALKKAILHRKNSLFYRTQNGAEVGDIYMSLIYTCQMCGANPFEYLQALQTHVDEVKKSAHEWLPWNYHQSLADTFLAVATRPGTAAPLGPRVRAPGV
jgi:transposase